MNIQVKNITYNLHFSEETNMFEGYLYVDGVRIGHCRNHGRGGSTSIQPMKIGDRDIIDKCETYCKTLPDVQGLSMNLELFVDLFVEDFITNKENQKNFKKGLVVKRNGVVEIVRWKGFSMKEILMNPDYWGMLKKEIRILKSKGYEIVNDNLPNEVL